MAERRRNTSANSFQRTSFLAVLLGIFVLFLYMVKGFVMAVFIGAIFTGLTYPVFRRIEKWVKFRIPAALITLSLILLIIILPLSAVGFLAYKEAINVISHLELAALQQKLESFLRGIYADPNWFFGSIIVSLPIDPDNMDYAQLAKDTAGVMKNLVHYLFSGGATLSKSIVGSLVEFGLILFSMFYFYLDGPGIIKRVIRLSPMDDAYEKRIIEKFVSVTRATLKGALLIGIAQGVLGGFVLWSVGIPSPVFWSILMTVLSIIPGVGVAVVMVPVTIFLFIKGSLLSGAVVLGTSIIIGLIDNFLRPVLVGKDLKMHDLLILFSTLGGIGMFGLPGFFIGPIIASLLVTILNIYEEVFKKELNRNQDRRRRPDRRPSDKKSGRADGKRPPSAPPNPRKLEK